jgi:hypothetical protein
VDIPNGQIFLKISIVFCRLDFGLSVKRQHILLFGILCFAVGNLVFDSAGSLPMPQSPGFRARRKGAFFVDIDVAPRED